MCYSLNMKLKDKVAIITGGTSGIGFAIAKLFSEQGAKIVIASDKSENGNDIAKSISSDCLFIQTDVREESQVKRLISKTIEMFSKLDILVNSAGVYSFSQGDIAQMPTADFDWIMNINFKGVFLTTKFAIPELLKTKGNIINISSAFGIVPEKNPPFIARQNRQSLCFQKQSLCNFRKKGCE